MCEADINKHWSWSNYHIGLLLVKSHRSALECGSHHILCLPPYHCKLNHTELTWVQIKASLCDYKICMSLAFPCSSSTLHAHPEQNTVWDTVIFNNYFSFNITTRCTQKFFNLMRGVTTVVSRVPLLDDGRIKSTESTAINFKTTGCVIQWHSVK